MVSYKEIAKPADDVLEKQFVHNRPWAVDLKHKLDNPSLKLASHLNGEGKVSCVSSSGMAVGPVTLNGLLGIDGSASLQMSYNSDILCQGLSLQANVISTVKTVREQKCELQAIYAKDPWKLHGTLNPVDRKWGLSLLGKHTLPTYGHALLYGVDVSGDKTTKPTLSGAALGYSYPVKGHVISTSLSVSPYGDQQIGKISATVTSQTVNQSELAARYTYLPSEDRGELTVGAGWIVDPKTKLTSVKAKIDDNANIAAAITHKLNDCASITLGVGFDGSRKIDSMNAAKVGVKLNLIA